MDQIFALVVFCFLDANAVELAHGNAMAGQNGRTPSSPTLRPEIPEALPNITVAVGREAILPCVVKNLKDYKARITLSSLN